MLSHKSVKKTRQNRIMQTKSAFRMHFQITKQILPSGHSTLRKRCYNVDIWLTFGCKVDNQISTYASTFAAQILRTTSKLRCFNFVLQFTDTKKIIIAHISIQIDLIFRQTSLIDWKLGQKRPPSPLEENSTRKKSYKFSLREKVINC